MDIFAQLLYGLISGITEILPVSSQAHQALLRKLFGVAQREPLMDLMIHFGILMALITGCRTHISKLMRDQRMSVGVRKRAGVGRNLSGVYELRLVKAAALPLSVGLFSYLTFQQIEQSLLSVSVFLLLNGIMLYISGHMRQGNKEARSMTGLDGVLLGVSGAASAVPGISRIGIISCVAMARGADKRHSLNWALLLSIPALLVFMVIDILGILSVGIGTISASSILACIAASIAAFLGGYISILLLQFILVRVDLSGFSYYSWGLAMLSFILYLVV